MFQLCEVNAQTEKQREKAFNKEYKQKIKFFKKGGYVLAGSSRSFDVALIDHYSKLNANNKNKELVVTVSNCPTEHLCYSKALTNAIIQYAFKANNIVKGRVISSEGYNELSKKNKDAIDKFFGAYEILIQQDCSQLFSNSSFAVKRKNGKKTFEYTVYYIYNEEEAMEMAANSVLEELNKLDANEEWANKIHEFINEGFKNE